MNRFSPWGWLALALTAYILLLGFAYTYFRDRRAVTTGDTTGIARDTDILTPPSLPDTVPDANSALSNALLPNTTEAERATLDLPLTDGVVKSEDGWVTVTGNISELRFPEYLFIVVQSDSAGRPINYLQEAILPDANGDFSVPVKYGTPGNMYSTFVIGTQDAEAALRLRALGPFAEVPPEFDIVSEQNAHLVE